MTDTKPDPSTHSRSLMRGAVKATLATALPNQEGWPYASLVTVAHSHDLSPVLLLSTLSDHTRALAEDPRLSLLYEATEGFSNPQQGPRVTVLGRAEKTEDPVLKARFIARHPRAAMYAGFGDFAFYRVDIDRVHYVGGFAAAHWIPARRLGIPSDACAASFADAENGINEHMNADHADAVALYATKLLGRRGKHWRMTGIDPDGIDLCLKESRARLDFDRQLQDAGESRRMLVDLVGQARARQ